MVCPFTEEMQKGVIIHYSKMESPIMVRKKFRISPKKLPRLPSLTRAFNRFLNSEVSKNTLFPLIIRYLHLKSSCFVC